MSVSPLQIFPGGSEVKVSASNAGGLGLIPGLGRSPGEGNGNPLQYGESHGRRCLVGYSPRGHKESNTTEQLHSLTYFSSVQFSSVTQSCPTLCDPMNHSTPGLPVHHQLPEFTQTHVRRVSDAIQPSHPLSSPSPPAPNPSQHQSLFQ